MNNFTIKITQSTWEIQAYQWRFVWLVPKMLLLGLYTNGPLLGEETMEIKEQL